jgi:hypothetical protein
VTPVVLQKDYLGANVDVIAPLAAMAKQTVYKHFSTAEPLACKVVQ